MVQKSSEAYLRLTKAERISRLYLENQRIQSWMSSISSLTGERSQSPRLTKLFCFEWKENSIENTALFIVSLSISTFIRFEFPSLALKPAMPSISLNEGPHVLASITSPNTSLPPKFIVVYIVSPSTDPSKYPILKDPTLGHEGHENRRLGFPSQPTPLMTMQLEPESKSI